jgi:predicted type IV restriction endonuclease
MGNDPEHDRLRQAIHDAAAKAKRYHDRGIGEQNTKASLVEPILEALGWDIRDPDEVHREFRPTGRDSPVDYALKLIRKPRLFLEAKGLGEDLGDRKWIAQVLGYAVVAGVEWCVLTDGDCYRFYNAAAPVDAEEKLFCSMQLSEAEESKAIAILELISRRNMEENLLDVRWSAHFVDRRVKATLQGMFRSVDRSLVRLIHRKTLKLTPKEIAESLRRLDLRVELITAVPAAPTSPELPHTNQDPKPLGAGQRRPKTLARKGKAKSHFGVTLSDVIAAGLIKPPLPLFRKYKGRLLEATLHADGSVEFQGTRHPSCSTAAEIARGTVTGRRMNTNGWSFWQCRDGDGKAKELIAIRTEFLATHRRMPPGPGRAT